MDDLTKATDEELAFALTGASDNLRDQILAEVERRKAVLESAKPFNPRIDISADARYLWKNFFIWFWLVPAGAIGLYFLIASLK